MRLISFFILFLFSLSAISQRTLITDKAIVKQVFDLRGTAIDSITKDSSFSNADHVSLPTAKAVRDYVESRFFPGVNVYVISGLSDTSLISNPHEGDIAYVDSTMIAFRESLEWLVFKGGSNLPDGDYGDIDISGGGAVHTVDASAINSDKILDGTIANADLSSGVGGIFKGSGPLPDHVSVTGNSKDLLMDGMRNWRARGVTTLGGTSYRFGLFKDLTAGTTDRYVGFQAGAYVFAWDNSSSKFKAGAYSEGSGLNRYFEWNSDNITLQNFGTGSTGLKGILYASDISSNYTDRSLIDRGYLNTRLSALTFPTNLTFTGSGPFSLNSSSGTGVTITAGTNITINRTGNNLDISATGGGGSSFYQNIQDDGVAETQQEVLDFVDNSEMEITVSDSTGKTKVQVNAKPFGIALNKLATADAYSLLGNPTGVPTSYQPVGIGYGMQFADGDLEPDSAYWATKLALEDSVAVLKAIIAGLSGVTDADYGDITVSGSGTNWQIDTDAVTTTEILDATIAVGDIAQNGATNHDVLAWDGSAWGATFDNSVTQTSNCMYMATVKGGIYDGSGSVKTGAIEITLPNITYASNNYVRIEVSMYGNGGGKLDFTIDGYFTNTFTWNSTSGARQFGASASALDVRFGAEGGRPVIWIGELTTAWSGINIAVHDVIYNSISGTNPTYAQIGSGWAVAVESTAFGTVSTQQTSFLPQGKFIYANDATDLRLTTAQTVLTQKYNGNFTGAVEITLPNPSALSGATGYFLVRVTIYNLSTVLQEFDIRFDYAFTSRAMSGRAVRAITGANPSYGFRFGDNGSVGKIWIGELTTAWTSQNVSLELLKVSNLTQAQISALLSGWSIGTETSAFDSVDGTITGPVSGSVPYTSDNGFSYSANLIYDGSNLAIGSPSASARLHVKGNGSTSSTWSSWFQNSSGTFLSGQRDDGVFLIGGSGVPTSGFNFELASGDGKIGSYKIDGTSSTAGKDGWISTYDETTDRVKLMTYVKEFAALSTPSPTTTVTTDTTWTTVSTATMDFGDGWSGSSGVLTYEGLTNRFNIQMDVYGDSNSTFGGVIEFAVFKNGVRTGCFSGMALPFSSAPDNCSSNAILSLSDGDDLELKVRVEDVGSIGDTFDFRNLSVTIQPL